jgi:hypothetical protein
MKMSCLKSHWRNERFLKIETTDRKKFSGCQKMLYQLSNPTPASGTALQATGVASFKE